MTRNEMPRKQWIVLLEAADTNGGSTIDPASFDRLLSSWARSAPTALYSPNRYALQLPMTAADPPIALSSAISRWKDALRRSGLPEWELVRAEIMTPDELEQEWAAAEGGSGAVGPTAEGPPHAEMVSNELLRRALHDPVTGLVGRELFLDEVRRAAATAAVGCARAVMVVHADGHGSAERSYGRPPSDELLKQIARRLAETLRRGDKVARVGPAEFAVLVEVPSGDHSDSVARRIVHCVGRPLPGEAQPLPITASVGVATMQYGRDADQVIGMAEAAMAAAREAGGDCHRPFPASPHDVKPRPLSGDGCS
jgi:diguanylate cyclase (GGDEF)-like protein